MERPPDWSIRATTPAAGRTPFPLPAVPDQASEHIPTGNLQANRLSRSFFRLIRPVDISGETEIVEEDLRDEEERDMVITDLSMGRRWPAFNVPVHLLRKRRVLLGLAACVVLFGTLATWLLIPHVSNPASAQHAARVFARATYLGSLYQPTWTDDAQPVSVVGSSGVGEMCSQRLSPQSICGQQHLSFVDDWGNLYSWDQSTGKIVKKLAIKPGVFETTSYFSWHWLYPGRYIVSYEQIPGSPDTYRLWDVTRGKLLFTTPALPSFPANTEPFALTSNGWIAVLTPQHTLSIWNANLGSSFQPIGFTLSSPYFAHLISLNWSPDGTQLATASSDGAIQIWDPFADGVLFQTLKVKRAQDAPPLQMVSLIWSPDEQRLASDISLDAQNSPIQIWDLQSGDLLQSYTRQGINWGNLVWLDHGTEMLSDGSAGVQVWNAATGRVIKDIRQQMEAATFVFSDTRLQLSSDKRWLILPQGYDGIQIIDLHTNKLLRTLAVKDNAMQLDMALSPDSSRLAIVDEDGQIQIWNVQSGQLVTTYKLPANFISQASIIGTASSPWEIPVTLTWSLDSQMLATTYQGGGLVVLGFNS